VSFAAAESCSRSLFYALPFSKISLSDPFFLGKIHQNVTLPKERKKALKEDDERERERKQIESHL
jgi:hypothetical protein